MNSSHWGIVETDRGFYYRVQTKTGLDTLAFEHKMHIRDFVSAHTSYVRDLHIWRQATKPTSNLKQLEDYITEREIPEAPKLYENHHIRSYSGDALGRGAVVY